MTSVLRRAGVGLLTAALLVVAGFLGAAWFNHWTFHIVQSASMTPTVPRDSLAAVSPVDGRSVRVGDVVAFRPTDRPDLTVIHRVVERIEQGNAVFYRTKGDANDEPDARLVPAPAIQGKVTYDLRGAGVVARQLRPPWTWLILVGGPLALLLAGERRRGRRHQVAPGTQIGDDQIGDGRVPDGQRLAGDRAWLAPFGPAGRGVAQPAHPSPTARPAAHQSHEEP